MNLEKMTTEELEKELKKRKDSEHNEALRRREAYEGIRADLIRQIQQKAEVLNVDATSFADFCNNEGFAFLAVMADYGQLRNPSQGSFTLKEGNFRWEMKRNKVKKFDERADIAAERLIQFLQNWIQNQPDGTENPMYQLAMTLLERNKYGDLDYKSVSKLYDLEQKFNSEEYSSIMQLFKESNVVDGTAVNHYFYKKDEYGVWRKLEVSFNRL